MVLSSRGHHNRSYRSVVLGLLGVVLAFWLFTQTVTALHDAIRVARFSLRVSMGSLAAHAARASQAGACASTAGRVRRRAGGKGSEDQGREVSARIRAAQP